MDWAKVKAMSNAEVERRARTDPDNPPMTKAEAAKMRRVSIAKHVRQKIGLSQEEFAERFAIPLGTLRDWEQHRTEPDQTSINYLRVILGNPKAVIKALELAVITPAYATASAASTAPAPPVTARANPGAPTAIVSAKKRASRMRSARPASASPASPARAR